MKRYLFIFILLLPFVTFKSYGQCNGWAPLGTFDSIQASFDSATYTAIAAPVNKPPYIVYSDAMAGGRVSVATPGTTGNWNFDGKEGFSAGPTQYNCIAIGKGGKPYIAYVDLSTANNKVIVYYNSSPNLWNPLGKNGASLALAQYVSLAVDTSSGHDSVYVAYADGNSSYKLTVMKFKSPTWVSVGSKGFSTGAASYVSLKINNKTPYVAFSDAGNGNKTTVLQFNGGTWNNVGSSATASSGKAAFNSLAFDNAGKVYVAFQDSTNGNKGTLVTPGLLNIWGMQPGTTSFNNDPVSDISMYFNTVSNSLNIVYNDTKTDFVNAVAFNTGFGGTFSVLGNANFSAGNGKYCGITNTGGYPMVVYQDAMAGGKATLQQLGALGNSQWAYVSPPVGIDNAPPAAYGYNPSLAVNKGIPFVAFTDADSNKEKTSVMTFNGSSWNYVGPRNGVSASASKTPQLAVNPANNYLYVAYQGDSNSKYNPFVKEFNGSKWVSVGTGGQVDNCPINYISLSLDNKGTSYVAYDNNNSGNNGRLSVKSYSGGNWNYLGGSVVSGTGKASYISTAYDNTNKLLYVLFTDSTQPRGNGYDNVLYSNSGGGSWNNIGSPSNTGVAGEIGAIYNCVAVDNSGNVYVAYQDRATLRAEVWSYTGSAFVATTSGSLGTSYISPGAATNLCLKFDSLNNLYLSFNDGTNLNKVTVMEYPVSGTGWIIAGNPGISSGEIEGSTSLAFAGTTPFVAYQDRGVDVQRYSAAPKGSVKVTPGDVVICNGGSVVLTATGGSSYKWSTGATTSSISASTPGTNLYYVTSTLASGCPPDTAKSVVNISTGTDNIYTVVGNGDGAGLSSYGTGGYSGDGGQATAAELNTVTGVAFNPTGDTMYVADQQNDLVRRVIMSTGIISTIAGNGTQSYSGDGGPATAAGLSWPSGLAYYKGNLYIADQTNEVIRKVALKTGIITTIAGYGGIYGYNGDNIAATSAYLNNPTGVTFDNKGNMYIADYQNNLVRVVNTAGIINTFAGIPNSYGYDTSGRAANVSPLGFIASVAFDKTYSTLYLADQGYDLIQKINMSTGKLYTVAGDTTGAFVNSPVAGYSGDGGQAKAALLYAPIGVTVDGAGNVYIADEGNSVIREIATTGIISTIAGNGVSGYSGNTGPAISAELSYPWSVTLDPSGNIYIPDNFNNVVREVKICIGASATITVSPKDTVCANTTVTLTANATGGTAPYTYSWSGGTASGTSSSITVTPTVSTTYSLTVTDQTGIQSFDTIRVVVQHVTVNHSSSVICSGTTDTLIATGAKPTSYRWKPSTGLNTTTGTTVVATLPVGSYTYTVTDTTTFGCADSAKFTIKVNPTPTITISPAKATICRGGSVNLAANSGAGYYQWSPAAGLSAITTSTVTAGPVSTTTYTVIASTSAGCSSKDSVTVTVIPSPTITLSASSTSICGGGKAQITASGTGITGYTWSPAAGLSATSGATVAATPTVTTVYSVTATNGTCSVTDTITISVGSLTVNAGSQATTCYGTCNGTATASLSSGSYTYSWSDGQTTSTAIGLCAGTYTVTVTNSSGCTGKATVTVTQPPPLSETVTILSNSCSGTCSGSATVTANRGTPPYSYLWTSGQTTTLANNLCPGSYNIYVTDKNGCKDSTTAIINQTPQLHDSIVSSVNDLCFNGTTGSATIGTTGGTSPKFSWSPSGGTNATGTNLAAGTYTCTVSDANGCPPTQSTVTVTITQPTAIIINSDDTTICSGTATLHASATGGTPGYIFTWNGAATGPVFSTSKAGIYTVQVTDNNGCTANIFDTVNISSNITQTVTVVPGYTVCAGTPVTMKDITAGGTGTLSYNWYQVLVSGSQNIGTTPTIVVAPDSNTTYQVFACCGCNGSSTMASVSLSVVSAPIFTVCCDTTITTGQSVNLMTSSSSYSYVWTPTSGLSCSNCPNPVASPTVSTTYYVSSTNTVSGCITTDSVRVNVGENNIVFYHGITPNGDGHNDVWVIDNINLYPNTVYIYNRWGIIVWSADNYNNSTIVWKGFDSAGQPLPDATYFYLVKVNGTTYKGWVQLTR